MLSAADILAAELGEDVNPPKRSKTAKRPNGEPSVYDLANGADTERLLGHLGIAIYDGPKGKRFCDCVGCGESDALICADSGGVHCFHDRCAKSHPNTKFDGYRTNVDLVMTKDHLDKFEAAERICGWFGIEVPAAKTNGAATANDEVPEGYDVEQDWLEANGHGTNGAPRVSAEESQKPNTRNATTIADVITSWRTEGPLIHEPTGIVSLDELTGGGPVYGTRWYLSGAPDAGKTALLVQIAHVFAARGIAVGLLAVDEEPGDMVTRLAQRTGYARTHCEHRDHAVLERMRTDLAGLPIRFYADDWTIESAAADLAGWAATTTGRLAMLGVDSVQTVSCVAEHVARTGGRELSEVQAVTARSRAIRAAATQHRLIALATSELNRAAYASTDPTRQTSTLAASKWSGAIEYSARVMIGIRSVPGESDLIDLELAKNKHGPQARPGDPTTAHVFLRIDRRSQTLTEASYEPPPVEDPGEQQSERKRARVTADGEVVMTLVTERPGIGTRDLIAAAAGQGLSRDRVYAALDSLGDRIERREGKRDAKHHYPRGSE